MEVITALLLFFIVILGIQNRKLLSQLDELDSIRESLEEKIDKLEEEEKLNELDLSSFIIL